MVKNLRILFKERHELYAEGFKVKKFLKYKENILSSRKYFLPKPVKPIWELLILWFLCLLCMNLSLKFCGCRMKPAILIFILL